MSALSCDTGLTLLGPVSSGLFGLDCLLLTERTNTDASN
ncbi:hypothetical protein X971_5373 (plasmid) [Agrobacterium tumefaciens LBA4213 (Ach5)]|nr:hypothetical protein X971_5373 [Agrobacterium tumefaciens LBA4213 (Ach5)]